MSRFFSARHAALVPYTPGEQPQDRRYVKLNTNESPFPPSPAVVAAAAAEAGRLNLYSDPVCRVLRQKAAALYGVGPDNILPVNGSDEILFFAFRAFGDETHPFAFPDVTYGFYPVYADLCHIPAHILPLKDDFSVDPEDYVNLNENIVLELFRQLDEIGCVLQFVRTGRIAVTKSNVERLDQYIARREEDYNS